MEATDEYGWTCLKIAASAGHVDICRLLLDKEAQLEAKSIIGNTPLHLAASQGRVEIVRLLCDRGADVEACDNTGWKPLHIAAYWGRISVVKELIDERNAEINARDSDGRTALMYARQESELEVFSYLATHGGIE